MGVQLSPLCRPACLTCGAALLLSSAAMRPAAWRAAASLSASEAVVARSVRRIPAEGAGGAGYKPKRTPHSVCRTYLNDAHCSMLSARADHLLDMSALASQTTGR